MATDLDDSYIVIIFERVSMVAGQICCIVFGFDFGLDFVDVAD